MIVATPENLLCFFLSPSTRKETPIEYSTNSLSQESSFLSKTKKASSNITKKALVLATSALASNVEYCSSLRPKIKAC